MSERTMVKTDDPGCYDLYVAPGVVIELAREPFGWRFWGVVYDGVRVGGRSAVPSVLADVFDAMAVDAMAQKDRPA